MAQCSIPYPTHRLCWDCGRPIPQCFGYVLAGDAIAAVAGRISWAVVRERCGRCVEGLSLADGS